MTTIEVDRAGRVRLPDWTSAQVEIRQDTSPLFSDRWILASVVRSTYITATITLTDPNITTKYYDYVEDGTEVYW
jgi:hypothetical protein